MDDVLTCTLYLQKFVVKILFCEKALNYKKFYYNLPRSHHESDCTNGFVYSCGRYGSGHQGPMLQNFFVRNSRVYIVS
jgi:hypothetical protein